MEGDVEVAKMNAKNGENDNSSAKSFLLEESTETGLTLYDHLTRVLTKILDERPRNAVDIFEDYSKEAKHAKLASPTENLLNKVDVKTEVALAEIQEKLFSGEGEDDVEVEDEFPIPNIMELSFFFEQAGVGLNREEMFRIGMALKNLTESHPLEHARFWGKVFGIEQNYLVAEVEYREGEDEEDEEDVSDETTEDQEKQEADENEEEQEDDMPKISFKPPPVTPREDPRIGANKKTYFVCNEPGKPWVKLPHVTPQQIVSARQIKKFLTGRLDAPIVSYPPFLGNEGNYLRAQIARISAGTHISPAGFYQFDEDDVDDEEGAVPDNFILNTEFEPIPSKELINPSLSNWVHHVQHILPQGRCSWWNPKQSEDEEEEEPESDAEDEHPNDPQPEIGPPLLNPLSEDAPVNGMPPWSAHLSTQLVPQFAIAVIRSCLWPGAHTFAFGKTFENIYIGWGHKFSAEGFSPMAPPAIQQEFTMGPEIIEVDDPTPEEEAALLETQEEGEQDDQDEDGNYEDDDDD